MGASCQAESQPRLSFDETGPADVVCEALYGDAPDDGAAANVAVPAAAAAGRADRPAMWEAMHKAVGLEVLPPSSFDASPAERANRSGDGYADGPPEEATTQEPVDEDARSDASQQAREDALWRVRDGCPLYTIPERFRSDKEIVLEAITFEGAYCASYIDEELRRRDRDVVMRLVRADGALLEFAAEELRADREVVELALRTCSDALRFAAPELQADRSLKATAAARKKEEAKLAKKFADKCMPAKCLG
eukprot:TRINITY_DN10121_c0_g2_i2.p1 TRINITY_DN10121_c0_g2~~TRINITY_DN10121_c0_g2_i2.p1  ORF type:complete len:250 (+),score=82.24 TRINITY_DN10121_c0_g2_i2:79-828(+)